MKTTNFKLKQFLQVGCLLKPFVVDCIRLNDVFHRNFLNINFDIMNVF